MEKKQLERWKRRTNQKNGWHEQSGGRTIQGFKTLGFRATENHAAIHAPPNCLLKYHSRFVVGEVFQAELEWRRTNALPEQEKAEKLAKVVAAAKREWGVATRTGKAALRARKNQLDVSETMV